MVELATEAPPVLPARPVPPPPSPGRQQGALTGQGRFLLVVLGVGTVAFLVRLWIAGRGGGIGGTYGYDDGVYYAAADSLLGGRLPYRDFVLLHPPGVMLTLAPFAWLGRLSRDHVGLEAARVGWMLVGALNATLVARICRRSGLVAAAAGGLFYALWTPVALTETTIRLEPLVSCGLLLAVLLLGRRGAASSWPLLMAAGAALALAVSVKIWAIAPALLVVCWVARRAGVRAAGWTVLGAVTAGLLVDGPFLLAAPLRMTRMVVLDQVGRSHSLVDTQTRLAHVFLPGLVPDVPWSSGPVLLVVVAAVLGLVVVACIGTPSGRFALSLLLVEVTVLLLSPTFFSYYNAFAGPGLALVVGSVVGWGVGWFARRRRPGDRPGDRTGARPGARPLAARRPAVLALAGVLALVTGLVAVLPAAASLVADSRAVVSDPFPAPLLARLAASSRCVTSDSPDALLLTDLFARDLRRGCQVPVDLSGLTYDRDALPLRANKTSIPRSLNAGWQRDLGAYLFSGQSIFLLRPGSDGARGPVVRRVLELPLLRQGPGFALFSHVPSRALVARQGG